MANIEEQKKKKEKSIFMQAKIHTHERPHCGIQAGVFNQSDLEFGGWIHVASIAAVQLGLRPGRKQTSCHQHSGEITFLFSVLSKMCDFLPDQEPLHREPSMTFCTTLFVFPQNEQNKP